jgi:tRNA dimethylallyltransferase
MHKLLVICGPTAAGKTEYALRLAEQWQVPILNADSRQIYRDLPIGTAAPTADELRRAKHYFVGTHSLSESYNAGQFERDAMTVIRQLIAEREEQSAISERPIAILSGGSMLYIEAVCKGLDDIPEVPAAIRREVQQLYTEQGLPALQQAVREADPEYWAQVDQRNPQRLMHCLELCRATGGTYSALRKQSAISNQQSAVSDQQSAIRPFVVERQLITRPREELYERINARVLKMIEQGLVDEADRAFRMTIGDNYRSLTYESAFALLPNSLRTVGYQELLPYLLGQLPLEDAIAQIQLNTRHYAKRQMTWWRNR